jgi:hypothetical protein
MSLRRRLKSFLRRLYDFDYIIFLFSIIILSFFVDPLLEKLSREDLLVLSRLLIAVILAVIYLHIFRAKVFDGD